MNQQVSQVMQAMTAIMMMGMGAAITRPVVLQVVLKTEDIDDLREVLFTIYDSVSVLAGGKETRLEPELTLLQDKVSKLVTRGVLDPVFRDKIVPAYIKAVLAGDGVMAHFESRMLFREAVDRLMKKAKQ